LVKRFFNKIKQCRRIATRYDKLAVNYLAFIKLASIRVWLRAYEYAYRLLGRAEAFGAPEPFEQLFLNFVLVPLRHGTFGARFDIVDAETKASLRPAPVLRQ
jgi:hypothetical protein